VEKVKVEKVKVEKVKVEKVKVEKVKVVREVDPVGRPVHHQVTPLVNPLVSPEQELATVSRLRSPTKQVTLSSKKRLTQLTSH
jgi:hypothetical protein